MVGRLVLAAAAALALTSIGAAPATAEPTAPPFVFKNTVTGACIDDSELGLRGNACNGTNFQQWIRTWDGGTSTWELRNASTGACLDQSNEHGLRAFACNGTPYQRWAYSTTIGSLTNLQTGVCVDDSELGLRAMECNRSDFQRWQPFGRGS